jgi:hypothetical protein
MNSMITSDQEEKLYDSTNTLKCLKNYLDQNLKIIKDNFNSRHENEDMKAKSEFIRKRLDKTLSEILNKNNCYSHQAEKNKQKDFNDVYYIFLSINF